MASAHIHRYGTTEEMLGSVAIKNHINGTYNEKAHLRKVIDVDKYLKSPIVASPLKVYDACPFSNGAAVLILADKDFETDSQ